MHLDHQPENCAEENLRPACQACHLSFDSEHHAETRRRSLAQQDGALFPLPDDSRQEHRPPP
jgi:hypothetical protein